MEPSFAYEMEEAISLGIIPMLMSSLPSMLMGIATYVLTALTFYTMAKRRGLNHAWMAWVPVVDSWLLGSLSDQYRYVVKGQNRSKRKILLILQLISLGCGIAMTVMGIVAGAGIVKGGIEMMSEEQLIQAIMGPAIGIMGIWVPLMGVSIAYTIVRFMALYDVYTSMDPGNSVLFLVLSILFRVTEPFFLFFNRHKDGGMPPRKRQYQEPVFQQYDYDQYVYEQPKEEPREPWNQDEPKTYL